MIGALSYLVARTVRNRLVRQAERIRSPRYAVAMLAGLAYFWFFFFRNVSRGPRGIPGNPEVAAALASSFATMTTVVSVTLLATTAYIWIRGGVAGALAFQPAEVQFLFPAPLSRRALIAYKVARTQLLLLFNALIWMFLMQRWGLVLAAPLRFATAWAFFTLISLHRLAAALMQTEPMRGGGRLALTLAKAIAAGLVVLLVAGVVPVLRQARGADITATVRAVGGALDTSVAAYALYPFRLLFAPLLAAGTEAWMRAYAIVLGAAALHFAWVLSLDVPFEETAATATTELAKRIAAFRQSRSGVATVTGATKVKRDWLPLSPLGRPAVAIVWKNTLALSRTGGIRAAAFLVVVLAVLSASITSVDRRGSGGVAALIPIAAFFAMTLVMGPRALRNDLRQDLLSLSLLKSYPLRGAQLVAAELASPVIALTLVQLAMIALALFFLPPDLRARAGAGRLTTLAVLSPLALGALNSASIALQNGAALMFPAWVRLGSDSGGIEAIGQNLLFVAGALLALLLALVPPALVGGLATVLAGLVARDLAMAAGVVAGSAVLAGEVAWLVAGLGRLFEKTEPSALV